MLGTTYYHNTIRKHAIAFGTLFNDISVQNFDSNDQAQKTIEVPLSYAPKEKFFRRREERDSADENDTKVKTTLPRMGYELSSVEYDPDRQLNRNRKIVKVDSNDNTNYKSQFMRAPYSFGFNLYIKTRYMDHGLQIIEQILPYFQPELTVAIKDMSELDVVTDVPVILQGIDFEGEYEGAFEDGSVRVNAWALQFTTKGYLYFPTKDQGLIRKVLVDVGTNTDLNTAIAEERVIVEPDPSDAKADDSYDIKITYKDQ